MFLVQTKSHLLRSRYSVGTWTTRWWIVCYLPTRPDASHKSRFSDQLAKTERDHSSHLDRTPYLLLFMSIHQHTVIYWPPKSITTKRVKRHVFTESLAFFNIKSRIPYHIFPTILFFSGGIFFIIENNNYEKCIRSYKNDLPM